MARFRLAWDFARSNGIVCRHHGFSDFLKTACKKIHNALDPPFHNVKFEAANMKSSSIFLLIAVLAFLPVAHTADISGVITFKGTPPPEADYGPKMTEASP